MGHAADVPMPRPAALAVLVSLLSGVAACTTAEAPALDATIGRRHRPSEARLAQARGIVADIEGRLMAFRRVEGTWRDGDAAGGFAAFLDAGRAARIDERLEESDGSRSRVRYYFDGPALVHCTKDGDALSLSIFFDATGDVVQADKRAGGRLAALTPDEIRALRTHAEKLRLQAEATPTVP